MQGPSSAIAEHVIDALVASAKETPPGCFVEVGVYRGGSAWRLSKLAEEQGRLMFAYDTFKGIPYKDPVRDVHAVGDFGDTDFETVKQALPGVQVVQGIFPVSAVEMPRVAFAHIDCDQYQSVKESAEYLSPLMVEGGIMWFDDYGCLAGATAACEEVFGLGRLITTPFNKVMVRF